VSFVQHLKLKVGLVLLNFFSVGPSLIAGPVSMICYVKTLKFKIVLTDHVGAASYAVGMSEHSDRLVVWKAQQGISLG